MVELEVQLTFVIDWVRDDWLEGKRERSLFVALEKDLEGETDTVEVDILRVGLVGEPSCKKAMITSLPIMLWTYSEKDPHGSVV